MTDYELEQRMVMSGRGMELLYPPDLTKTYRQSLEDFKKEFELRDAEESKETEKVRP